MKKLLINFLKISFAAVLVWWLVSSGKINFSALKGLLEPKIFILCMLLSALSSMLISERWRLLVRESGAKTTFFAFYKLTLIGYFFNFAMPGGVGGDVIKAYYFYRDNPPTKRVAIASVVMDRLVGLMAMLGMALVAMLFDWQHVSQTPVLSSILVGLILVLAVFLFALALLRSKKLNTSGKLENLLLKLPLGDKFNKLYQAAFLVLRTPKALFGSIAISILAQTTSILLLFLVGYSMGGTEVSLATYFIVAPIGFIATAIPIAPAGVGVGQAAFLFLFSAYGVSSTQLGPTIITALQVFNFIFGLIGAGFYLTNRSIKDLSDIPQE